jgi:hypothetical protein
MRQNVDTERMVRHERGLVWYPERGFGFLQVTQEGQYGEDYWRLYQGYRSSPIAERLMRARVELVERHFPNGDVVDIGIGSGHFIEARHGMPWLSEVKLGHRLMHPTWGFDVNPLAVAWLKERGLWWNPWERECEAACCWDTLEHMERPENFLARVNRWLFVSIPIFDGPEHALRSKHFKPNEHYWYFTQPGLVGWMRTLGWELAEENRMETELGREDIGTFVFHRA